MGGIYGRRNEEMRLEPFVSENLYQFRSLQMKNWGALSGREGTASGGALGSEKQTNGFIKRGVRWGGGATGENMGKLLPLVEGRAIPKKRGARKTGTGVDKHLAI